MAVTQEIALEPEDRIFSRVTGRRVDERNFVGSKILLELTTGTRFEHDTQRSIIKSGNVTPSTIRRQPSEATSLRDIVTGVMAITHPDIDRQLREQLVSESFLRAFLNHPEERPYSDEVNRRYGQADLLRGMAAFGDAEFEYYNGIYTATLVEPATQFTRWLIAIETDITRAAPNLRVVD